MKNIFLSILIIALFFNIVLADNTVNLSLENILEKMESAEAKISNIKFEFNQQVDIKVTGENYKIKGYLVLDKPQKLYMETQSHTAQKIVSDGKFLWIYSPDYNQVNIEKLPKDTLKIGLGGEFLGLGLGKSIKNLAKNYKINLVEKQEKYYLLEVTSTTDENYIIMLWVSNVSWLPERVSVQTGEIIIMSDISNIQINTNIDKNIFKFKVPKGAVVFNSLVSE